MVLKERGFEGRRGRQLKLVACTDCSWLMAAGGWGMGVDFEGLAGVSAGRGVGPCFCRDLSLAFSDSKQAPAFY